MDVRCERCHAEYQVEDANVSDLGTEVQCSGCGHRFVVKPANVASSRAVGSREPRGQESGTWVIETATGRSLRLSDLTTLHKWIIEHRVEREDRLSRGGDSWQRLGDMAELVPFFDIVDSAEQAHSAATPLPAPPAAPLAIPVLTPPEIVPQVLRPERNSFEPFLDQRPGHRVIVPPAAPARPATAALPSSPYDGDADQTVIVRLEPAKSRRLLMLLLTALVASIVAYLGILWQHHSMRPSTRTLPGSAESPMLPGVVPPATPIPAAARNAEEAAEEEGGGSPTHGPLVHPIADSGLREKVPLLGTAPKHAAAGRSTASRKAKVQAAGRVQVAQVSSAKPNAPQALAAQGYVALNHHQPSRAIAFFKRALASNPTNGTALFGLAEAYRTGNQTALALQTYHRYVDVLPSGPDAASARTQIRILENRRR